MNARLVAALDAAAAASLLALAFLVPAAVQLKAYDPFAVRSALLSAGALLAAGAWLARALEAGRLEVPAPRAGLAGLAAALLAWTVLRPGPAADAALARAAGPALFLVVLLGPGSASFARSLCWAVLGAGGLCAAGLLAGLPGADAAAALCAAVLAVPLMRDPEAPGARRALAAALGGLCLLGAAAAAARFQPSPELLSAKAAGLGFLAGLVATHPLSGAGAGSLPALLLTGRPDAASVAAPLPVSEPLATAAELGLPGALLWTGILFAALSLALLDVRRRAAEGDARTAALSGALAAGLGLLLAAGLLAGTSCAPGPAALLWLMAGAASALALERGAATVRVLPVPLPPAARRALLVPLAAALAAQLWAPAARMAAELRLNRAVEAESRGEEDAALELYRSLRPGSLPGLQARLRAGRILLGAEGTEAALEARVELAAAARLRPGFGDLDYLLAETDRRRGEWRAAERGYALYAALNPGDARPYVPLAEMRQTLGDRPGAVAAARALVALRPADHEAWRFYAEQMHTIDALAARPLFQKAAQVRDLAQRPKAAVPTP